jgi:CRISPR/Cas system-associated protein Cas10 (large subunit of type III CRISPR-Cas system)
MSLIRKSDYQQESKKNKIVSPRRSSHGGIATSKKVRLPTQHKSPNHKCSLCERKDAKKYYLTEKECRWLCPVCVIKNKNRDSKEKVNFLKASQLELKIE